MMMKKRTTITISLLPVIWNLKKTMTITMTTTMMKMKTKTTIMSNLIPGMRMMKMRTTVVDAVMKTTTMTAVTASHGVRVSSETVADNTKAGATTAAKAVPAPTRVRAGVPHPAAAGVPLQWTATRAGAWPAKAAAHLIKAEAGMVMTKVAAAVQTADHLPRAANPPVTVARPLPPVAAVHRTTLPVAAVGRVPLPGPAIQVLRGTATLGNNATPADNSPAGAAVRVMAAGPIPVAVIATIAVTATATATAIAAIANHS